MTLMHMLWLDISFLITGLFRAVCGFQSFLEEVAKG